MNKNLIRHTTADKLARQSEVRQLHGAVGVNEAAT